jgi:hypothetical protein
MYSLVHSTSKPVAAVMVAVVAEAVEAAAEPLIPYGSIKHHVE